MNRISRNLKTLLLAAGLFSGLQVLGQPGAEPAPLLTGYNTSIAHVNQAPMAAAKGAGIDDIAVSFGVHVDCQTSEHITDEANITKQVSESKKSADEAGIEVWAVDIPFSRRSDISLANEAARGKAAVLNKKVLEYCRILQPKIILFQPSSYFK